MEIVGNGSVIQVGTFGANPLVLSVANVVLRDLLTPEAYRRVFELNRLLVDGYRAIVREHRLRAQVNGAGPNGIITFTDRPLKSYRDFMTADEGAFRLYWFAMMNRGVMPAHHYGGDVWTVSIVHTKEDIEAHLGAFERIAPMFR